MRWTAIVKRYEPFLAPSLVGRLRFHATRYRGAGDREGRGWITLDGEQVATFESLPYLVRTMGLSAELKDLGEQPDAAWDQAIEVAHREGLFYLSDYQSALARYPEHSVDEALASPDAVIRALAMLDRRLGRRRLARLELATDEIDLVRKLLGVRLDADHVELVSKSPIG